MDTSDISYLTSIIQDPVHLLTGERSGAMDVTKHILDLLDILREDPTLIKEQDYIATVIADGSQIGRPMNHLIHATNVAKINQDLTRKLQEAHPELDLPTPDQARVYSLLHDLAATFSLYDQHELKQHSKELPQFVLAAQFGLQDLADAAMHGSYFGLLKMIKDGAHFAEPSEGKEHYVKWSAALNDPNHPHSYTAIMDRFKLFLEGRDKLGTMVLSVADCIDLPGELVDVNEITAENIQGRFDIRLADIESRYQGTPLGISLAQGEKQRMRGYTTLVANLLQGTVPEGFDKESAPNLWRS